MSTGKSTTIARPYAIAAFEYAEAGKGASSLNEWETFLSAAALMVQDPAVKHLFSNPSVTPEQLRELFFSVLEKYLDTEKKNFLSLLVENSRLAVLPDIASLFKSYKAEQQKTLTVKVTSAVALDDAYQQKLISALTKKLQRQVMLDTQLDTSVIGGVLIEAGDTVIDGSIRGKLHRLLEFI